MAEKKKRPRIEVLERRLQNPFGEPSAPVRLVDDTRECRWFNAAVQNDHIWRAKHKGWEPVKPDELSDIDQIGGYGIDTSGFVVRGERGQEVLMAMPKEWRKQIQAAKIAQNIRNMGNPNRQKAEIVEAAGAKLGAEAADFLNKRMGSVGAVTDTYERIERVEPE